MTTWSNILSERYLASVSAVILSCLTFLIQYILNPVAPPNHNDFLGFDIGATILWFPWFTLETGLSAVFTSLKYFEVVSFIAVSSIAFSLYWVVDQLSGSRGGIAAATLYALSPFAVTAATVIPTPSLIGIALTAALLAAGFSRGRVAAGLTVLFGLLVGFFPVYSASFFLALVMAALLQWIGYEPSRSFNTTLSVVGMIPVFFGVVIVDWPVLQEVLTTSVSTISATLPAGFSVSTMLTWFGPLTILLSLIGVYRSLSDEASNTSYFAALGIIGVVLFAQRLVDPLLGFSFLVLSIFPLSGIAVDNLLGIDFRGKYTFVIYVVILTVLLIALVNLLAFMQTEVSASRPHVDDLQGYAGVDATLNSTLLTAPREAPLASYFVGSDRVSGGWQVDFSNATVFRAVFLTDLVERVGSNRSVVMSRWVRSQFERMHERFDQSTCFVEAYSLRDDFVVWENQCQVTVMTADRPLAT